MINWKQISTAIGHATNTHFELAHATPVAGGSINQSWRIEDHNNKYYFVKLNDSNKLGMFEAEQAGLKALASTKTIRVPEVIAYGVTSQHAYLILEFLDMRSRGNARLMGEQLAALHRCHADRFGFDQNNTLGETLQPNDWSSDWISFWREQRLGFQLDLATSNGYGGNIQKLGHELMGRLSELFDGYHPLPSLLHGDLWGGNLAFVTNGEPVIFDPAPYYGDRETDIAMTELFGGFSQEFYEGYRSSGPLDTGYASRKTLYNLYHILNHANMFGGGYAQQAEGMMQYLLK